MDAHEPIHDRRAPTEVDLPDFGMAEVVPEIPAAIYADRLERLRARAAQERYDHIVIYADREHSANLAYVTGFDPRFEEAMLVLGPSGEPAVLVGNECFGVAGGAADATPPVPGLQPAEPAARPLAHALEILADEGIVDGTRVGVIGWKTFADRGTLEVPAYIADELRRMTPRGRSRTPRTC